VRRAGKVHPVRGQKGSKGQYRGADNSLARPTSRCILFDAEDISLFRCYSYCFQTYKYPYIYYTTSLSWDSENNHGDDFSGSDDDFLGFYDE